MKFQADTLVYDINKIAAYRSDSRFDYNSQLRMPEDSWFEMLSRWFNRLVKYIFNGKFEETYTTPVMIALFLIALFSVLFFLYRKRPGIFMRSKKTAAQPYETEEENIRKIDFDREISNALNKGDFRFAIRMVYLHTLRILSDGKLIDWQIHKTPTEYLYEIGNREIKPLFRELTVLFLRVRYGNYEASPERFETVSLIRKNIRKIMDGGGMR